MNKTNAEPASVVDELPTHIHPIDKDAAKELFLSSSRFSSKECPTLCKVPVHEVSRRNQSHGGRFRDLTGQRLGKMVIVGLMVYRDQRRSSWAAKCDCGYYEQRNHRNWMKWYRRGVPDACIHCMSMEARVRVINRALGSDEAGKRQPRFVQIPLRRELLSLRK